VRRVESVGMALRVALDPADEATASDDALAAWLRTQGVPVQRASRPAPTLDDVFGALSESVAAGEEGRVEEARGRRGDGATRRRSGAS
jgi:membrane protein involved in colicin uptake